MSDYSKKYLAKTAWSNWIDKQEENQKNRLDYKTIGGLLNFPGQYKKTQANYDVGKEILNNLDKENVSKALKGIYDPVKLNQMSTYQKPEGLMKYVDSFKATKGYGTQADIANVGKEAMNMGQATELGASPEAIKGVETAGSSALTASAIIALLLGAGYGVGKRGSTLHRLFKGGRKD